MQYRICPDCGAHLDFCERCDCQDKKEAAPRQRKRPHENNTSAVSISVTARKVNERKS